MELTPAVELAAYRLVKDALDARCPCISLVPGRFMGYPVQPGHLDLCLVTAAFLKHHPDKVAAMTKPPDQGWDTRHAHLTDGKGIEVVWDWALKHYDPIDPTGLFALVHGFDNLSSDDKTHPLYSLGKRVRDNVPLHQRLEGLVRSAFDWRDENDCRTIVAYTKRWLCQAHLQMVCGLTAAWLADTGRRSVPPEYTNEETIRQVATSWFYSHGEPEYAAQGFANGFDGLVNYRDSFYHGIPREFPHQDRYDVFYAIGKKLHDHYFFRPAN